MKKDIEQREVLDFGLAFVPDPHEGAVLWDVYAVNLREEPIKNLLVNALARPQGNGKGASTAELRYYFPELGAQSYAHVEVIVPEVARLNNRYWVSFELGGYLYDKKYLVDGDVLDEDPDLILPLIGKLGHWFE
jgi:hypothetical protein